MTSQSKGEDFVITLSLLLKSVTMQWREGSKLRDVINGCPLRQFFLIVINSYAAIGKGEIEGSHFEVHSLVDPGTNFGILGIQVTIVAISSVSVDLRVEVQQYIFQSLFQTYVTRKLMHFLNGSIYCKKHHLLRLV